MTLPNDIETRVLNTRIKPRSEMRSKVLTDALRTQEARSMHNHAGVSFSIWRIVMKNRTTKCATVAIIVIAVLLGMHLLANSLDGTGVVWA